MEIVLFSLKRKIVYVDGIPVARTHFPLLHLYFCGYRGWKQDKERALRKLGIQTKILCRFFGRVILWDNSHAEFWKLPKIQRLSSATRIGWLYWAIGCSNEFFYPHPKLRDWNKDK